MERTTETLRQQVERVGYAAVSGVLTADEVSALRRVVKEHLDHQGVQLRLGRTQPDAAVAIPALTDLFAHPKVLAAVSDVIGAGEVVFTRHCDAHLNMVSGWHKDSGESVPGGYFKGDYFGSPACRVYKVAVYLQDSVEPGSGLTVVPASHRDSSLNTQPSIAVPLSAGDVLIFDVRLTHIGHFPDLVEKVLLGVARLFSRGRGAKTDPNVVFRTHQAYWRLRRRQDRISVFFTFGAANSFTADFATANIARQHRQTDGAVQGTSSDVLRLADALRAQGAMTFGVDFG